MIDPEIFDVLNTSQQGCSLRAWLGNEKTVPHYAEDALDLMLIRAYENAADKEAILSDLRYCRHQLDDAIKALEKLNKEDE